MSRRPEISVIIPVLNEQPSVAAAVDAAWQAGADQVVVVDGESTDQTGEIAAQCNCLYLTSPPGRGIQQNVGAEYSAGHVLLFLHVDCRLPSQAIEQIRHCVAVEQCRWGCFQQRIDANAWIYRWLESGNRERVRWRNLVYGDQGLWVTKTLLDEVSGVPRVPIMEDVILSLRLKKLAKPVLLPGPLHVSPRRWQAHGVVRQTLRNWLLYGLFRLGVPPTRLARYYQRR